MKRKSRWRPGDADTMFWIILLAGVISAAFYAAVMSFAYGYTRDEEQQAFECQQTASELFINGELVDLPDMNAVECEAAKQMLDQQTPPFTPMDCRERYVCRQEG